ncbi:Type III pantothenate kinase [Candidatus Izimaplasma bacterium HR1]|jgi:type III pantothenate kinase|uniref:type III pantothenate kinase n=1 Tax=Candidatus Izimoplasma sp. HR1 TaxID=1541959 RepID=UPI0004F8C3A1|nr:Type III pantothenate kinase [Candidatus Izimaplasma bacterium HR1]
MIILVDIGNSNIVVTRHDGADFSTMYRYNTDKTKSVDEYFVILKDIIFDAKAFVISSVVPELNIIFKNLVQKYLNLDAMFIGPGVKTGIKIITDNPKEVGSDIVSSAAAVTENYSKNAIVVDMGTATTFTLIEEKVIKGVAICAGLVTQKNAVVGNASQLSQFEFRTPTKALGSNTIDALNSGLIFGNSEMIKGMVKRIKQSTKKDVEVIITGGASRFVKDVLQTENFIFDDLLLLKGLLVIYNKNK